MSRPVKRRKTSTAVEEVVFDPNARHEYLTGFRKRKLQRIKHAQEEAAKKEKQFRIEQRKQLREQRQKELEEHVETVNSMLKKAKEDSGAIASDTAEPEATDSSDSDVERPEQHDAGREEEYVDEDKFTTVTIEPMNSEEDEEDESDTAKAPGSTEDTPLGEPGSNTKNKRIWTKEKATTAKPKKKRKKFRYETKAERKSEHVKQKARNSAAKERRTTARG